MSPPHRQSMAQISVELGIFTLQLEECWRLQEEVVPASEKEPEGWTAAIKFTVVCPMSTT